MSVSPARKLSAAALTAVLVAGTGAAFVPACLATYEMRGFCAGLAPGTPKAAVRASAESRRYDVWPDDAGAWTLEHPSSLGRARCSVAFDDAGLLRTRAAAP
jgi:hypothetical protein